MTAGRRAGDLERRKSVRVRLRPNLVFAVQQYEGRTYHVVKDPVTLEFFRLDEGQDFAVGLMDGTHTLGEIQQAYEEKFRPEHLPLEELEAFASQLLEAGLAQNESARAGQLLHERARKRRREAWRAKLLNFLSVKIPLIDPDRPLGWLARRVGFLFSAWGVLAGVVLVLAALGLIVTRWDEFLARLPEHREFFTARTILYLWLAVGLAKVLHELGHGICSKVQGSEVHEAGVRFLVLFPVLYCDVSDSWRLPSKWRRMAISAAGIYVDLLIASAAILVWWASATGSLIHDLCFALAVVCSVGTIAWNANPLLRFDGYYVLSDWLEVPNLAEESSRFLRTSWLRWLGFAVPVEPLPSRRRPGFFVGYAVASYLYRTFVACVIIYFLCTFLKPYKLGAIGFALALAALFVLVARPAWGMARAACSKGRLADVKPARLWLVLGFLLVLCALFFLVPFPMSVTGLARIEVDPDHTQRIIVPETGGFLQQVQVRDGQRVRAGDVLAVLSNRQLEVKLRVNEVDQALRSQQRTDQTTELADGSEERTVAGLQQADYELAALAREHAALREQRDWLTLRAPRDGVVLGLLPGESKGKWLEKGTELCRVGDAGARRAVLLVEPGDQRLVRAGSRAKVRVHGLGPDSWEGAVAKVALVDAKRVPAALSTRAGGEVATQQDAGGGDRPRNQQYLAAVSLPGTGGGVQPGVMGRVKIEAAAQTAWWRVHRYLARTFNWGL